jgi:GNAT superfamily N-acetyltransferase
MMRVRAASTADREWMAPYLEEKWGGIVVSRGVVHRPVELPALVAHANGERHGLLTYRVTGDACEIVTLDADPPRGGGGTALLEALAERLRGTGCRRLWLVTTNDNLDALRFYQRRGFALKRVHPGALAASRRRKPSIPLVGNHGIPLRDELELERSVD